MKFWEEVGGESECDGRVQGGVCGFVVIVMLIGEFNFAYLKELLLLRLGIVRRG